jgi:hypothetical protein
MESEVAREVGEGRSGSARWVRLHEVRRNQIETRGCERQVGARETGRWLCADGARKTEEVVKRRKECGIVIA